MIPRIHNGDYVVVQKDAPPDHGEAALVRMDSTGGNEYAIKIPIKMGQQMELRSLNPANPPYRRPLSSILSVEKIVYIIHK